MMAKIEGAPKAFESSWISWKKTQSCEPSSQVICQGIFSDQFACVWTSGPMASFGLWDSMGNGLWDWKYVELWPWETLVETSLGNLIAMENQHCFHSAKSSTFKMASILAHSALGQGATGLHDRELLHLRWQERDQTGPRRGCRSAWDVGATEIGKIGEAGKGSHWQKGPQNSTV